MRILDWECTINHDGTVRAATHPENGNIVWVNGRIIGSCDAPAEVVEWIIRPRLWATWGVAFAQGQLSAKLRDSPPNPYEEPPNKDREPS